MVSLFGKSLRCFYCLTVGRISSTQRKTNLSQLVTINFLTAETEDQTELPCWKTRELTTEQAWQFLDKLLDNVTKQWNRMMDRDEKEKWPFSFTIFQRHYVQSLVKSDLAYNITT